MVGIEIFLWKKEGKKLGFLWMNEMMIDIGLYVDWRVMMIEKMMMCEEGFVKKEDVFVEWRGTFDHSNLMRLI